MSSLGTSSPVSASTFAYLMRCPVFRFSWLKEIFSDSDVAGYNATGQLTRERRRKPFQLARGAMRGNSDTSQDSRRSARLGSDIRSQSPRIISRVRLSGTRLDRSWYVLIGHD